MDRLVEAMRGWGRDCASIVAIEREQAARLWIVVYDDSEQTRWRMPVTDNVFEDGPSFIVEAAAKQLAA